MSVDIKELRKATQLSQQQFADLFHVPYSTLRNWETGRRKPPEYILYMICTILEQQHLIQGLRGTLSAWESGHVVRKGNVS